MNIPPLPAPIRKQGQQMAYDGYDKVFFDCYDKNQMLDFYQKGREAALEEAAAWLDFYDGKNMRRAEQIRSMK